MDPTNLPEPVPSPPRKSAKPAEEVTRIVAETDYQWKQYFAAQSDTIGADLETLKVKYLNLVVLQAQQEERYRCMLTASWAMIESVWEG